MEAIIFLIVNWWDLIVTIALIIMAVVLFNYIYKRNQSRMEAFFFRVKNWIYTFVVFTVAFVVGVRAYGAIQRVNYKDDVIYNNGGGVEVFISHPAVIPGPKIDATYALTLRFFNQGVKDGSLLRKFIFDAPGLLFVNAKGEGIDPSVEIPGDFGSIEKTVYVRPFLAEDSPVEYPVSVRVLLNGVEQGAGSQFTIHNASGFAYTASFVASSFPEISIVLGLATWFIYILDNLLKYRKDLMEKRKKDLKKVDKLPLLSQARQLVDLEKKHGSEAWDSNLAEDLQRKQGAFGRRELEFFQAAGTALSTGQTVELAGLEREYTRLFGKLIPNHAESALALEKMVGPAVASSQNASFWHWPGQKAVAPVPTQLELTTWLFKLWDDFSDDVKDLVVETLDRYPGKDVLSRLQKADLQTLPPALPNPNNQRLFDSFEHRRLLRVEKISRVFPKFDPPPFEYSTPWEPVQKYAGDAPATLDWLAGKSLAANPFGFDPDLYPFFLPETPRPGGWDALLRAAPALIICPANEDVLPLAGLLRRDAFQKLVFPFIVRLKTERPGCDPLESLVRAAASAWLDVLPGNPEALHDLPLESQRSLLEMLCWSVGNRDSLKTLLMQNGLKTGPAGESLGRKIDGFKGHWPGPTAPSEWVLLDWAGIRPPGMDSSLLLLCLEEEAFPAMYAWCNRLSPLLQPLARQKVALKAFSSTFAPAPFPLPKMKPVWTDEQLRNTLNAQFNAAIDPAVRNQKHVLFPELFGPYSTEEETTDKLVGKARGSLARMLSSGNRLLREHCSQTPVEEYLYPEKI